MRRVDQSIESLSKRARNNETLSYHEWDRLIANRDAVVGAKRTLAALYSEDVQRFVARRVSEGKGEFLASLDSLAVFITEG